MTKYIFSIVLLCFLSCKNSTTSTTPKPINKMPIEQREEIKSQWVESRLIGKYWNVDQILGFDEPQPTKFTLYPIDTTNEYGGYGYNILLEPDMTFTCSYAAPCGNDCFPSSEGTYEFITEDKVYFTVNHISQSGTCKNFEKEVDQPLGIFKMNESDSLKITFQKVDSE